MSPHWIFFHQRSMERRMHRNVCNDRPTPLGCLLDDLIIVPHISSRVSPSFPFPHFHYRDANRATSLHLGWQWDGWSCWALSVCGGLSFCSLFLSLSVSLIYFFTSINQNVQTPLISLVTLGACLAYFPLIAGQNTQHPKLREERINLAYSLWRFPSILGGLQGRVARLRSNSSLQQQQWKGQREKLRLPSRIVCACTLHLRQSIPVLDNEPIKNFRLSCFERPTLHDHVRL